MSDDQVLVPVEQDAISFYGHRIAHFHVPRYTEIPDARWDEIVEWLRVRIAAAEKRHGR